MLERVREPKAFAAVQEFIERYGAGLFTQHLLAPSSLRGILRGGVKHFLEHLVDRAMEQPEDGLSHKPQTGKLPDAVPWIIMPWELLHSVLEK